MTSNRIVSSTIVRPEQTDSSSSLPSPTSATRPDRTQGRKRSFPDAPEPARHHRSDITTRLGGLSESKIPSSSSSTTTTIAQTLSSSSSQERSSATGGTRVVPGGSSNESSAAAVSASALSADITDASHTTTTEPTRPDHEETINQDSATTTTTTEDRSKRPRLNTQAPAEDAKRGRRMMGMILGTLTQFKKQGVSESGLTGGSRGGAGSSSSSNPLSHAGGVASREALQERVREKLRREQVLNEERRQEEMAQRQQGFSARSGPGARRRGEVRWENGYILTETRPRLRYMPKVMNDATRKNFEIQQKQRSDRIPPSTSSSSTAPTTSITTSAIAGIGSAGKTSTSEAKPSSTATVKATAASKASEESSGATGMELDLDDMNGDLVVDKDGGDHERESAIKVDDSVVSDASSITVPASPSAEESAEKTGAAQDEDVVMADQQQASKEEAASSKDVSEKKSGDKPDMITISLV